MTPLSRYIWLIEQLQKKDMTFGEINEQWLRDRKGTEDENIPICKRTFHNHIKAIHEEYGIDIECGRGYKYYIDDPFNDVASKVEHLSMMNLLSETFLDSKLNKNLYFEDYYNIFRDKTIILIMNAIKTRRKVMLDYGPIDMPDDNYRVLNVAPYQLHYMDLIWFLIGQTEEFGLMRIPLFTLCGKTQITKDFYRFPIDYSPEKYNKLFYGPTNERLYLTIKIQDYQPERLNLKNFPLSPFQQEIVYGYKDKNHDSCLGENNVRINFDMPKSAFALYMLKSSLGPCNYTVLNDPDPFTLFTEEQYNNEVYYPVVLSARG